jgi:aspartate/methionine/tyrosine aminotransferase
MNGEVEPFHSIAISRLAHKLQSEGRSVIRMEFGQPSTGAPREAIAAAHRWLDTDPMGYWESPQLKTRLARHYRDSYGVEVAPDQFILTCGASPALVLALVSRFGAGDRIAVARPGYVAYRNTIRALHMIPVEIPCGPEQRFQLTAEALVAIDPPPRGVIIASPANPTGTIIGAAELDAIARVCRDRRIQIVSDEIYHGLSYVGRLIRSWSSSRSRWSSTASRSTSAWSGGDWAGCWFRQIICSGRERTSEICSSRLRRSANTPRSLHSIVARSWKVT